MSHKALLFPGQGAQKVGMGVDFVEKSALAREFFERADATLGYSLSSLIIEGPAEDLTLTKHCQPAIYLTSAAIVAVLEAEGHLKREEIVCTAGLSLGEYTALYYAGVFSFEEGLRLVAARGQAMQKASDLNKSGMVSLMGADESKAQAVADAARGDDVLVVANLLSPGQIVLSGTIDACKRVPEIAKSMGVRRAIALNVAGAFHSPVMAPAAAALKAELASVDFKSPSIPVVVNVSGEFSSDAHELRSALERQIVEAVRWQQSMTKILAQGTRAFVEPGPGKVLSGLMRKIDKEAISKNFEVIEDLN